MISSSYIGVFSRNGFATVTNYGTIQGGDAGVVLKGSAGSVTNSGTIVGTALFGVYLYAGGSGSNAVGGLIEGRYDGVLVTTAPGRS